MGSSSGHNIGDNTDEFCDNIFECFNVSDKASGGSMDWVRHTFETPLVYTYELRGSSFHWPPRKIKEQGEEVVQMIYGLSEGAKKLKYY